jgi:hypothetical protein
MNTPLSPQGPKGRERVKEHEVRDASKERETTSSLSLLSFAKSLVASMLASSDFPPKVALAQAPAHPEFLILLGSWFWNGKGGFGAEEDIKVRFLFNESHFALLNGCPFNCKFARNKDQESPYVYCGFAYPDREHGAEQLKAWASKFPKASVFTRGEFVGDEWRPGKFIEDLPPTA